MSESAVTGYWNTGKVCEYFGGINSRTLQRWRSERTDDPFPAPKHGGQGKKSLYSAAEVIDWDKRNQLKNE